MAAFIATFLFLLVFGLVISNPSAISAEREVAASNLTQEEAMAGDTARVTQPPAANTPSTDPATPPPAAGGQAGDPNTGGVAPVPGKPSGKGDDAVSGGSDGNSSGGGGGSDAREPDFVEQDPSLSDGGASPDDDGTGTFEIDRLNVPNFVINNFEIPPFLLPIYQACGSEYGIPWEVLASINRAETNFGTNLSYSSAGAMGWMQFMPASWAEWGVDANGDKVKDPYNPVDAICAAGNYLEYFGYADDPYDAIFAYNHADWYVQLILEYAQIYSAIPPEMISALTGLTEGARFPVAAESSYEDEISTEAAKKEGTAAQDVSSSADRTAISIQAEGGAPVIAVNDGTITDIDSQTGTVILEDVYGNRYSYAGLGSIASVHPVPQNEDTGDTRQSVEDAPATANDDADPALEMGTAKASDRPRARKPKSNPQVKPEAPVSDGAISEVLVDPDAAARAAAEQAAGESPDEASVEPMAVAEERRAEQEELSAQTEATREAMNTEDMRGRTYASPLRPSNQNRATIEGQSTQTSATTVAMAGGVEGKPGDYLIYDGSRAGVYRFKEGTAILKPLRKGSKVIAGTVLGRLTEQANPSLTFSIQPGGEDTPQIDPKPFLDGWRLLAETNIYNAQGKNRFADRLGIGGVLLLSKSALQRRVLADPNISLPECDRQYIAGGAIDRRVLAALAFASEKGYEMLITSMYCGREVSITTSGNISNHSRASAADIAAINGEVVTAASQGPGSLTDRLAREFLSLQGIMAPDEVITLLDYPQPAGIAMGDHDDHLHIGFGASSDADEPGGSIQSTLGAEQWTRLTERLGQITNPEVPTTPSDDSLPAEKSDRGN